MKSRKTDPKETGSSSSTETIVKELLNPEDLKLKLAKANSFISAQEETIDKLNKEIEKLQELLASRLEASPASSSFLEDEKIIADIQLKKLKDVALSRSLTLEETRKFEIFSKIKNQDFLSDRNSGKSGNLPRDVTPKTLLTIASSSVVKKVEE
jgi:hypothetical protein